MRFYNLTISDEASGAVIQTWSSTLDGTPTGRNNGAALRIEFDIPLAGYSVPMDGSFIRVWGISFDTIGQAHNFNDQFVSLSLGMTNGLPLANANQVNQVFSGKIFQAFGNFQGTNLSLDLIIIPATGSPQYPVNLAFNASKNQSLGNAAAISIRNAYSNYFKVVDNSSQDIIWTEGTWGTFSDLHAMAQKLNAMSKVVNTDPNYAGIDIYVNQKTITIDDGTAPAPEPTQINFNDMMSQPTWLNLITIQLELVARGDLSNLQYVKLPPFVGQNNNQSQSRWRDNSTFTGIGKIIRTRHIGDLRQPTGTAWRTVIDVLMQQGPTQ